jgi:hypothetical protein
MDFKDILYLKSVFSYIDNEQLFAVFQSIQDYPKFIHADLQTLNDCVRDLIKEIKSPKNFLEEWKQPLATLLGAIVGAALAFLYNLWIHNRKGEQEKQKQNMRQWNNLNAALAALEETRVGVLTFKSQHLEQYKSDADAINGVKKKAEKDTNDQILSNYWHDKNNIKSFFESFSSIAINKFSYEGMLDFSALGRSPYLITFFILSGELNEINIQINRRNDFTTTMLRYSFNKNEPFSLNKIIIAIAQHTSTAENLDKLTDTTLARIDICKEHIDDCATKLFPFKKLVKPHLQTNYENLMPAHDYLQGYKNMINNAIDEDESYNRSRFQKFFRSIRQFFSQP